MKFINIFTNNNIRNHSTSIISETDQQLSDEAQIIYALLKLKFAETQKKNDEVFCNFTIREFQRITKMSKYKIIKCKRELSRANLIKEEHILGLASKFYLNKKD